MKYIPYLLSVCLLLCGCGKGGRTLTSATGSIYECLVVAPATPLQQDEINLVAQYNLNHQGGAYDEQITNLQELISAIMAEPMPCMPQMESYFKITSVAPQHFDEYLMPTRNILYVDINKDKYTQTKVRYQKDQWSKPQAVCRVQAPSTQSFVEYWLENGTAIREWMVREELRRATTFLRGGSNPDARRALQKTIGVDMLIPSDYQLIKDTTDFVWCCNNKGPMRKDLVIYRYPYTDANTFSREYLCAKRDEILSHHIGASVEGSYMGTEYKVFPPQFRYVNRLPDGKKNANDFYAGELRGLWKIKNGEAMGGPFVSLTRIDEVNHNVVTAEVFIFASGQKKRSAIRQSEAILYTMELPQEANQLEDVEIHPESK